MNGYTCYPSNIYDVYVVDGQGCPQEHWAVFAVSAESERSFAEERLKENPTHTHQHIVIHRVSNVTS